MIMRYTTIWEVYYYACIVSSCVYPLNFDWHCCFNPLPVGLPRPSIWNWQTPYAVRPIIKLIHTQSLTPPVSMVITSNESRLSNWYPNRQKFGKHLPLPWQTSAALHEYIAPHNYVASIHGHLLNPYSHNTFPSAQFKPLHSLYILLILDIVVCT